VAGLFFAKSRAAAILLYLWITGATIYGYAMDMPLAHLGILLEGWVRPPGIVVSVCVSTLVAALSFIKSRTVAGILLCLFIWEVSGISALG